MPLQRFELFVGKFPVHSFELGILGAELCRQAFRVRSDAQSQAVLFDFVDAAHRLAFDADKRESFGRVLRLNLEV